jgi:serine/threonine protein kinase
MSDNRTLNSRYTLDGEIGRGGMGVVYRAEDAQMRRVVAIKTLPSIMTHNQELMRRFNSEIQHASRLEHPNIARVYDVGEDAGTNYYVMQYIDGKSLRELLKEKGRLTLEEALPILEQVASALDYAHSQGIIHRDIKPENILLDKTDNAFVVDFGIAKAAEGTRTTRGMLGTPEYMSPEQIRGEVVDGRSDQYSLAVVAYEMLTGQTPFKTEGNDPWAQIQKHLNEKVIDPRQMGITISGNAANSLFKSLNKSSEQRFEKCVDLISGLRDEINVVDLVPKVVKDNGSLIKLIILTVVILSFVIFWKIRHSPLNIIISKVNNGKIEQITKTITSIVYIDASGKVPSLCKRPIEGGAQETIMYLPKNCYSCFVSQDGSSVIYPEKDKIILWNKSGQTKSFNIISQNKIYGLLMADVNKDLTRVLILADINADQYKTENNLYILNIIDGSVIKCKESKVWSTYFVNGSLDYVAYSLDENKDEYSGGFPLSCISIDKKRISHYSNGTIICYDSNGNKIKTIPTNNVKPKAMTFSYDGKSIIYQDDIGLWQNYIFENRLIKICDVTLVNASQLMANPDNQHIIYTMEDANYSGDYAPPLQVGNISLTGENKILIPFDKALRTSDMQMVLDTGDVFFCGEYFSTDERALFRINKDQVIKIANDTLLFNRIITEYVIQSEKEKILKHKTIIGLKEGFRLEDTVNADFDGDGKLEQAYWASKNDSRLDVWVVKDGTIIWKIPDDYGGDTLVMHAFKAVDITGDSIPELVINFTNGILVAEDINDYVDIYKWKNNTFVNVSPFKDMNYEISTRYKRISTNDGKLTIKVSDDIDLKQSRFNIINATNKYYKWEDKNDRFVGFTQ